MSLEELFGLDPRPAEGGARCSRIASAAVGNALAPGQRKWEGILTARVGRTFDLENMIGCGFVALAQGEEHPLIGNAHLGIRVFGHDRVDSCMERA